MLVTIQSVWECVTFFTMLTDKARTILHCSMKNKSWSTLGNQWCNWTRRNHAAQPRLFHTITWSLICRRLTKRHLTYNKHTPSPSSFLQLFLSDLLSFVKWPWLQKSTSPPKKFCINIINLPKSHSGSRSQTLLLLLCSCYRPHSVRAVHNASLVPLKLHHSPQTVDVDLQLALQCCLPCDVHVKKRKRRKKIRFADLIKF